MCQSNAYRDLSTFGRWKARAWIVCVRNGSAHDVYFCDLVECVLDPKGAQPSTLTEGERVKVTSAQSRMRTPARSPRSPSLAPRKKDAFLRGVWAGRRCGMARALHQELE